MRRAPWTIGAIALATLGLAGCVAAGPAPQHPQTPQSVLRPTPSALGAGFYDPTRLPAPESTLTPRPGSWDAVHPPAGYTATLLTLGDDAATQALVAAVKSWADAEHVELTVAKPSADADLIGAVYGAAAKKTDLVITAGDGLVDAVAAATPTLADQPFLVLGAEIAEPTSNVTAADWDGAGYRGEGLGLPSDYDPASFTEERAGRALRAGVAALLNELNGLVIWVG